MDKPILNAASDEPYVMLPGDIIDIGVGHNTIVCVNGKLILPAGLILTFLCRGGSDIRSWCLFACSCLFRSGKGSRGSFPSISHKRIAKH